MIIFGQGTFEFTRPILIGRLNIGNMQKLNNTRSEYVQLPLVYIAGVQSIFQNIVQ